MRPGRGWAANTAWNLAGQALPLVAAVATIPILVGGLGPIKFGVLALVWALIGYFSILDFGLGRALTQSVSQRLALGQYDDLSDLVPTALAVMFGIGAAGMVIVFACADGAVTRVLSAPADLRSEVVQTVRLLAVTFPFVVTSAGLRGVLEAHQRFDIVNIVRIPVGIFNYVGPAIVLSISHSLVPVVAVVAIARVVQCLIFGAVCVHVQPNIWRSPKLTTGALPPLLRTGGWMTVSNIVGPLLTYVDRFVIGAVASLAAVAYYVTPYEMVTKMWVVPTATAGVLFPAFAGWFQTDRQQLRKTFDSGSKLLLIALFPPTFLIAVLSDELLKVWLGTGFQVHSTLVLQFLALGVLLNSVAYVPFALLQAAGRSDMTAKLHAAELPVYLVGLWWLVSVRGIEGAAFMWTLRLAAETALLFVFSERLLGKRSSDSILLALGPAAGLIIFAMLRLPYTQWLRPIVAVAILVVLAPLAWMILLTPRERAQVLARARRVEKTPVRPANDDRGPALDSAIASQSGSRSRQ